MNIKKYSLPVLLLVGAFAVFGFAQPAATPYISGLSSVDHIPAYGGCVPSYTLNGATVNSWSISGDAVLGHSWGNTTIVETTGHGAFTVTAHSSQGNYSKTVRVVSGAPCP